MQTLNKIRGHEKIMLKKKYTKQCSCVGQFAEKSKGLNDIKRKRKTRKHIYHFPSLRMIYLSQRSFIFCFEVFFSESINC